MKPRPPVICLLNSVTTPSESCAPASPANAPATTVARTPRNELPVWALTTTAIKAPTSISGSRPMLTMPPCRLTRPPMAASRMAVVAGAAAASVPSSASGTLHPSAHEGQPAELDDGEDHHGSLEDVDEVEGDVAEQLDHRATAAERAEEDGGEHDPDRVAAA